VKAVILVGGQGTRLRPLTVNRPKPLLPVGNVPFLTHVFGHLRRHGIDEIILAVQYLPDRFRQFYGDGSAYGVRLTVADEPEPMGTAGAVKNVEQYLDPDETFLAFNGDVLTDLDITDMLRYHKERGAALTISLTPVEDTSSYGVVDMNANGRISRFIEKPKREDAPSNLINAGIYILEPEALAMMPAAQHYMFEFGLFPTLLERGRPMYGYNPPAQTYWMDIGKPERYLDANSDLLNGKVAGLAWQPVGSQYREGVWADEGCDISPEAHFSGAVILGRRCRIAAGARIVGPVVMGDNCSIGREANVTEAVLWEGANVGEGATLHRCIIGENASIAPRASISGGAVIGDRASIGAGNKLANGIRINCNINLPDEAITF